MKELLNDLSIGKRIFQLHSELCSTMSNPIRLEIIDLLRGGERSVGELATAAGTSQANMSQHLHVMRQRGIVEARRQGVTIYYRLVNAKTLKAFDILREILFEQLQKDHMLIEKLTAVSKASEGKD